jgi:hypothetical protein
MCFGSDIRWQLAGGVGISKWPPNPGAVRNSEWPPDLGAVRTFKWALGPGGY